MQKEIQITSHDGKTFSAFAAWPQDENAPVVVVIQEIFGVNENMREICRQLAQSGYIAVCPDLFWRQQPGVQLTDQSDAEWQQAFALLQGFDLDLGVKDLQSTITAARKDAACNGKAGAVGYCLGGKLAYLVATRTDADCSVGYYGIEIDQFLDEAKNIKGKLLLHIAEKDKYVPADAQQKILAAFENHAHVEAHLYHDVDHAFARVGGAHYDADAASRANARTADFLATCLGHGEQE